MPHPRHAPAAILLAALLLPPACRAPGAGGSDRPSDSSLDSYRRAREAVERALAAAGDLPEGGLVLELEGTLDRGAELQGSSPESRDPGPYRETLAVDPANGRAAWEYRSDRADGTWEWVRFAYPGAERKLITVLEADPPFQVLLSSPEHDDERRRLLRRLPRELLAELLEQPAALRWIGRRGADAAVSGALSSGSGVTAVFSGGTGRLRRVEYLIDIPGLGDSEVTWQLDDYRPVAGAGELPHRTRVTVAERTFLDLTLVGAATDAARLDRLMAPLDAAAGGTLPAPIVLPERRDVSAGATVEQLAEGVYRVRNLRPGFNPLFVELDELVVAVDAPAGYPLLGELPAGDVAPGPSSAWLAERYLELIRETVPDKPLAVVLSHFHGDHAGGVRAFVAAGARVLAAPPAAAAVRRLVEAPHTLAPDRLARAPRELRLEVVTGAHTLGSGARRVEILDVGPNPHTDAMLVVRLPALDWLFVSDLLDAAPLDRFPAANHAALDRFFAGWLAARALEPARVYAMHGDAPVTAEHLARLRPLANAPAD